MSHIDYKKACERISKSVRRPLMLGSSPTICDRTAAKISVNGIFCQEKRIYFTLLPFTGLTRASWVFRHSYTRLLVRRPIYLVSKKKRNPSPQHMLLSPRRPEIAKYSNEERYFGRRSMLLGNDSPGDSCAFSLRKQLLVLNIHSGLWLGPGK